VVDVYRDAYAGAIASEDPFETVEAFLARFDAYTSRDDFDLLLASEDGQPVGLAFGWPLRPPDGGWWRWLTTDVEPGFAAEDGRRTFALSEIMVRRACAGRGIGHTVHDELLDARRERRAVLLVRPENVWAYRAYLHRGWRKAAELRGGWPDAPLFDVLTVSLPLRG
jgi:GNAT superfamily N-acetyltransferase